MISHRTRNQTFDFPIRGSREKCCEEIVFEGVQAFSVRFLLSKTINLLHLVKEPKGHSEDRALRVGAHRTRG